MNIQYIKPYMSAVVWQGKTLNTLECGYINVGGNGRESLKKPSCRYSGLRGHSSPT